jgi:hypothetical protein
VSQIAHFAEIDNDGIVKQVLVVPDQQEHRGQDFLANDLGLGGTWIQTSYNHRIRKQYAGIGFKYDAAADVFIAPQPFPSWTLDENHDWQAPKAKPEDGLVYFWNEEKLDWEAFVNDAI